MVKITSDMLPIVWTIVVKLADKISTTTHAIANLNVFAS